MKKQFSITKISKHLFYAMLSVVFFASCEEMTKQIIYEDKGLIVTGVKLGDAPERGKYIYYTTDHDGKVVVWSNGEFKIGDTLLLSKKNY